MQIPGLQESVGLIREMVGREAEVLGGRWDRVVLAGIRYVLSINLRWFWCCLWAAVVWGVGKRWLMWVGG